MKKVLIYGGTTEGRKLAEILAKAGIYSLVCVATEYGEQVLEEAEWIQVHTGRMDVEKMQEILEEGEYLAVVDATHPFATVVSENVRASLKDYPEIPYYRLGRELDHELPAENKCDRRKLEIHRFSNSEDCAKALLETEGKILLTTGSKELAVFCKEEALKERLVVRVLPGQESIALCYENGLLGKQIIAMQGPFSMEMNLATIKQYDINCLVTKESGKTGGLDTKFEAAKEADIPCFLIEKPREVSELQVLSFEEVCKELEKLLNVSIELESHLNVVLAGIGMGDEDSMTVELADLLKKTDYLFGADRMLRGHKGRLGTYPFYLAKDIIPMLKTIQNENMKDATVTILYSGDSGFYSGTKKMKKELEMMEHVSVSILPGISSLSYFAAKLGESWQDVKIISTHGVLEKNWRAVLEDSIQHCSKTFFITSGVKDVRTIGEILSEQELHGLEFQLYLGYQLSYEEEKVWQATALDCMEMEDTGLYVGMVLSLNCQKRAVSPQLTDDQFVRDKVPMTKEEIRHLSVCKLGLHQNSIVYDIGSGTGSIAIEMARLSPEIAVYAIETNETALDLIKENVKKFHTSNVTVIGAMAPEGLEELPAPDCAFIGGSKGKLKDIIDVLRAKNPSIRIVANAVSLETLREFQELEKEYEPKDFSITQVSVTHTKKMGSYHMMQAENPVWICSLQF